MFDIDIASIAAGIVMTHNVDNSSICIADNLYALTMSLHIISPSQKYTAIAMNIRYISNIVMIVALHLMPISHCPCHCLGGA